MLVCQCKYFPREGPVVMQEGMRTLAGPSSGGSELHTAHKPLTWTPPGPGVRRQGGGTGALPGGRDKGVGSQ